MNKENKRLHKYNIRY